MPTFHQIYLYLVFMGSSCVVALFNCLRVNLQWIHSLLSHIILICFKYKLVCFLYDAIGRDSNFSGLIVMQGVEFWYAHYMGNHKKTYFGPNYTQNPTAYYAHK